MKWPLSVINFYSLLKTRGDLWFKELNQDDEVDFNVETILMEPEETLFFRGMPGWKQVLPPEEYEEYLYWHNRFKPDYKPDPVLDRRKTNRRKSCI